MTIRWVTAFLDLPAAAAESGTGFWGAVAASTPSARRGERGEFRTLLPADGDPCLRVQVVVDGPGGVHLDLHVDDVEVLAARAVELGAEVVARPGHVVLRSPGGLLLCAVGHHGETIPPAPVPLGASATRVDQVSIDVPAPDFDRECRFWAELTGWELRASRLSEFAALERPPGIPWRLLLQRLGPDDAGGAARAHLDVACGPEVDAAIAHHVSLGALRGADGVVWTTMTDPAGLAYCLTRRDPLTGLIES